MTVQIRTEFLAALDAAFGSIEYGVIGGAALSKYGHSRDTSDIDVIVPNDVGLVVENQLLARGMVRTAGGGLGGDSEPLFLCRKSFLLAPFTLHKLHSGI